MKTGMADIPLFPHPIAGRRLLHPISRDGFSINSTMFSLLLLDLTVPNTILVLQLLNTFLIAVILFRTSKCCKNRCKKNNSVDIQLQQTYNKNRQ